MEIENLKFGNTISSRDQGPELQRTYYETMFTEKYVFQIGKEELPENHRQRLVPGTAPMRMVFPQISVLSQVAGESKHVYAIEMEND